MRTTRFGAVALVGAVVAVLAVNVSCSGTSGASDTGTGTEDAAGEALGDVPGDSGAPDALDEVSGDPAGGTDGEAEAGAECGSADACAAPGDGAGEAGGDGACVADCEGKECGDDGCGGECGTCPAAAPLCVESLCAVGCPEAECDAGAAECVGEGSVRECVALPAPCEASGKWGDAAACPDDGTCAEGKCTSGDPCAAAGFKGTSLGCEFVSVDLDLYPDPFSAVPPDASPHGVILANPGTVLANVTFETSAAGIVLQTLATAVEPGASQTVQMPVMSLDGSVLSNLSVRIESDRPIAAYQVNPLDPAAAANDSSLLLPVQALGNEYWILSWPSSPIEQIPLPGAPPSQHDYFTVVATYPGITNVNLSVPVASQALAVVGGPLLPGKTYSLSLAQWQVLQVETDCAIKNEPYDMSGARVTSDQPVAVFSGHEEAAVCPGNPDAACCADHLEEQLPPATSVGTQYACVKTAKRGPKDKDVWRVMAADDAVLLATDPPVAGLDGAILGGPGKFVEASTDASFMLTASAPVLVEQYLVGRDCAGGTLGDPSLISGIPVERFKTSYVLAPAPGYQEQHATVVRAAGSFVALGDSMLADAEFSPLGGSGFEHALLSVPASGALLECEAPCGAWVYGYSDTASYGHPAGY